MYDHYEKTHIKTNSNTDSTGFSFNSFNMIDKSIVEDLIKCDICNKTFDTSSHTPLMLKCGIPFVRDVLLIKVVIRKKILIKNVLLIKKRI